MATTKKRGGDDLESQLQGVLGNVPQHEEVMDRPQDENSVYGPYKNAARNAHIMASLRRTSTFKQATQPSSSEDALHQEQELELAAYRRSRILGDDGQTLLDSRLSHTKSGRFQKLHPLAVWERAVRFVNTPSIIHTIVFLAMLGAVGGTFLFTIDLTVDFLSEAHSKLVKTSDNIYVQTLLYFIFQVSMVIIAVAITHLIAPGAAGSGIPEMRSILSGISLPAYLSPTTLFGKAFGLIFTTGSGLFLGKEGPFVHLSCALADLLIRLKPFRYLRFSKVLYNQILAAAVSVGVAGTFGAPVGGVLFSIEVTAQYFMTSNYPKCFLAAVASAVLMRMFGTFAGKRDEFSSLFYTDFGRIPFNRVELIVFAIVGAVCGVLGCVFITTVKKIVLFRRTHPRLLGRSRYRYSILICLLNSLLFFPVGEFTRNGMKSSLNDLFLNSPLSTTPQCHATDWQRYPGVIFNLLLFIAIKLAMCSLAVTCPMPTGVFTPIFTIGACTGRLIGEIMYRMFPDGIGGSGRIYAGGYAVVGAAAMSTGATRTISPALVVFELTGEIHHLIPALIAVLVSLAVSNSICPGIYDTITALRGLPYLRAPTNSANYMLVASQVMRTDFPFVFNKITAEKLAVILRSWPNTEVFPLVGDEDSMLLIGCVRRKGLDFLLRRQVVEYVVNQRQMDRNTDGKRLLEAWENAQDQGKRVDLAQMIGQTLPTETQDLLTSAVSPEVNDLSTHAIPAADSHDPMSQIVSTTSRAEANATTEAERRLDMNNIAHRVIKLRIQDEINFHHEALAWLVDASPYQVVEETPLSKVYHMLTMLGVDRVYITRLGALVGEITTENLLDERL